MSGSDQLLSSPFRWRLPSLLLLAILALPAALAARFPVQEVSTSVVTENRRSSHPRRVNQLIEVARDLPGERNSLLLRYWRTSTRRPDKGRLVVRVEILRDVDGDGTPEPFDGVVIKRDLRFGLVEWTWSELPPLREGDLIQISFRLRRMPRIPPYESAFAEATLGEDLR